MPFKLSWDNHDGIDVLPLIVIVVEVCVGTVFKLIETTQHMINKKVSLSLILPVSR